MENAFQKVELNAKDTARMKISNPKFPVKVTKPSNSPLDY